MAYLGNIKRNEEIPITLTLDSTPTGTPTYRILDSSRTEIVAATSLAGSGLSWYKTGQNTDVAATVGSYLVEYTAVINGVTRYAYDSYDVTIKDADDVTTYLTDTIKVDTAQIAAIKTVTDQMVFTETNRLDVTIHNVAEVENEEVYT